MNPTDLFRSPKMGVRGPTERTDVVQISFEKKLGHNKRGSIVLQLTLWAVTTF